MIRNDDEPELGTNCQDASVTAGRGSGQAPQSAPVPQQVPISGAVLPAMGEE